MATITAVPGPRTWYGRRTHKVVIADPTGRITFHGYTRKGAALLARTLGPIVSNRPIGALANILARELTLTEPAPGQEWVAKL